ncbi:hypothetical protein [Streptomyces sp. CB00455]|uniref:hypothetical protein n=1 Tax=Streptomyces sp. CB00455 TaxID=1703927 RepID=UPI0009A120F0|nr:hypothetical protein [Streptomyces sp. CB00455]
MIAELSALLVAVVGVGGTLGATLMAQRARRDEVSVQNERAERERRQDLEERAVEGRREVYAALNGAARAYLMAGQDAVLALQRGEALDPAFETARVAYRDQYALAQMVLPDLPLRVAAETNRSLGFGRLLLLQFESGSDQDKTFQQIMEWNHGPLKNSLRLLRQVLRDDLGVAPLDRSEVQESVAQLAIATKDLQRRMLAEGAWPGAPQLTFPAG